MQRYNLFHEQSLFDFQVGDLSITWDDESKELVMNGTLRAVYSPLRITYFILALPYEWYSGAIFHNSGTASTDTANINIISDGGESFVIPILRENGVNHVCANLTGTKFTQIMLTATEDTVFDNYRFNLLISHEQSVVHS